MFYSAAHWNKADGMSIRIVCVCVLSQIRTVAENGLIQQRQCGLSICTEASVNINNNSHGI